MENKKEGSINYIWGVLRILIGLIFLWAFFDKLWGLGFSTPEDKSWLDGISPTAGFLANGVRGPLASLYHGLAGQAWVDWVFMIGLLGIGVALILGIFVNLASVTGSIMLFLMWAAALPPEHHPFLDEHIIYIFVLIGFIFAHAGRYIGLGEWWSEMKLIKKYRVLE